ncbi:hypothetical protein ABVK25_011951 [Lepraria finkii]|uniref:Uncharacterized protein n=1 Tax=Lepraria finkii TaxID=1340010 RepID=A0ABR4AJE5_9LECA
MAILIQETLSPSLALIVASLELIVWENFGISYLTVPHDTRKSQRTGSIFMGASAHLRTANLPTKVYGNFVDQVDNFDDVFLAPIQRRFYTSTLSNAYSSNLPTKPWSQAAT